MFRENLCQNFFIEIALNDYEYYLAGVNNSTSYSPLGDKEAELI